MNKAPTICRVILRTPVKSDAEQVWIWRQQEELNRHQPLIELSFSQLQDDLLRCGYRFADRFSRDRFHWIIERNADRTPVGWITLSIRNRLHQIGEIGYSLSADFHQKGYGTEAIGQFLSLAFRELDLYRIEAKCSVHNEASYRLLEKCGFEREGILRSYLMIRSQRVDHYLYSALRDK